MGLFPHLKILPREYFFFAKFSFQKSSSTEPYFFPSVLYLVQESVQHTDVRIYAYMDLFKYAVQKRPCPFFPSAPKR